MSNQKQKYKSMILAGTISIPPRFPNLAVITFSTELGRKLIVATEDLTPKLQITRTFFSDDVKAIFFPKDPDKKIDLEDGNWTYPDDIKALFGKGANPDRKGIIYVNENAQSQLEVQAGLTAAESAEYFPPLPDDRSVNHYAMEKGGVGCPDIPIVVPPSYGP